MTRKAKPAGNTRWPSIKTEALLRALERKGWVVERQAGPHR